MWASLSRAELRKGPWKRDHVGEGAKGGGHAKSGAGASGDAGCSAGVGTWGCAPPLEDDGLRSSGRPGGRSPRTTTTNHTECEFGGQGWADHRARARGMASGRTVHTRTHGESPMHIPLVQGALAPVLGMGERAPLAVRRACPYGPPEPRSAQGDHPRTWTRGQKLILGCRLRVRKIAYLPHPGVHQPPYQLCYKVHHKPQGVQ